MNKERNVVKWIPFNWWLGEMPWLKKKNSVSVARTSVLLKTKTKNQTPPPTPHPLNPTVVITHLHFINASEVLMKWEQLSAPREQVCECASVRAWVTGVWSDADD